MRVLLICRCGQYGPGRGPTPLAPAACRVIDLAAGLNAFRGQRFGLPDPHGALAYRPSLDFSPEKSRLEPKPLCKSVNGVVKDVSKWFGTQTVWSMY